MLHCPSASATTLANVDNAPNVHHYNDVIMSAMASQITRVLIVCSAVCPGADQRKHLSSASQACVRGIHRWPVDSPHKGPVTRKCFYLMTSPWFLGHKKFQLTSWRSETWVFATRFVASPVGCSTVDGGSPSSGISSMTSPVPTPKPTIPLKWRQQSINTLRPRQNCRHFADDIFNAFSWMKM